MNVATNAADWPTRGLDEGMLAPDPHEQFERWMPDVIEAGLHEPPVQLDALCARGRYRVLRIEFPEHTRYFLNGLPVVLRSCK